MCVCVGTGMVVGCLAMNGMAMHPPFQVPPFLRTRCCVVIPLPPHPRLIHCSVVCWTSMVLSSLVPSCPPLTEPRTESCSSSPWRALGSRCVCLLLCFGSDAPVKAKRLICAVVVTAVV